MRAPTKRKVIKHTRITGGLPSLAGSARGWSIDTQQGSGEVVKVTADARSLHAAVFCLEIEHLPDGASLPMQPYQACERQSKHSHIRR
jgi:hypothetical protein